LTLDFLGAGFASAETRHAKSAADIRGLGGKARNGQESQESGERQKWQEWQGSNLRHPVLETGFFAGHRETKPDNGAV
jgi:hypothetical protein